jgi:hypothetical protein
LSDIVVLLRVKGLVWVVASRVKVVTMKVRVMVRMGGDATEMIAVRELYTEGGRREGEVRKEGGRGRRGRCIALDALVQSSPDRR